MKKIHLTSYYIGVLLISAIFVFCGQTAAQNRVDLDNENILPPAKEDFQKVDTLASPWRSSGCLVTNHKFREPDCYFPKGEEYVTADTLSLYNADGSIWFRFSLTFEKPDYFLKDISKNFVPFAIPYNNFIDPHTIILRMVGESPNWYEVEVNEETRETKYILKNDPFWAKTTWSRWLYEGTNLQLDNKEFPLLDKPDGKVIEESANLTFKRVKFLKAEGDWAYVEGYIFPTRHQGWIRWRKGRDILVGTVFNGMKVPELKAVTEDK